MENYEAIPVADYRIICQIAALSAFFDWADTPSSTLPANQGLEEDLTALNIPSNLLNLDPMRLKYTSVESLEIGLRPKYGPPAPFEQLSHNLDSIAETSTHDQMASQLTSNEVAQFFLDLSMDSRPHVATAATVALIKSLGIGHITIHIDEVHRINELYNEIDNHQPSQTFYSGRTLREAINLTQLRGESAQELTPVFEFILKPSLIAENKISRIIANTAFALSGREPDSSLMPYTSPGRHFTLIHGTFAAASPWPNYDSSFFAFLTSHSVNHYTSRPQSCFRWSGAYSRRKRRIAAKNLMEWQLEAQNISAVNGFFGTYIAHSYGADVAAHMLRQYSKHLSTIHPKLIALSAPVTKNLVAIGNDLIDIRLSFDFVLALDSAVQRISAYPKPKGSQIKSIVIPAFPPNSKPLWHPSTHEPSTWIDYDLVTKCGI